LFDGIANTPSGYWPNELMGIDVAEIDFSLALSYKLKIEMKPNSHIYCYLNDVLKLDYFIQNGIINSGKFALVTANSGYQFSDISSSYIPNTYLWSTGETIATINPSPTETTTYWCDVTVNGATCRKEITIAVNPNVTPSFTQVSPICSGATLNALPTTSTNGITGTWSPALNNSATTTYTFTPTDGQCATISTMTIMVNNLNTFYIDADGDGFGAGTPVLLCSTTTPSGYATNNLDCNDVLRTLTTSCVVTIPLKVPRQNLMLHYLPNLNIT
jgi:hypothetical protein